MNKSDSQSPEDWLNNFTHEVASGEFVIDKANFNRSYSQGAQGEAIFKFHAASKYMVFVPKTNHQFVYSKEPGGLLSGFNNGMPEEKVLFNLKEIEKYRLKNYEREEVKGYVK